MNLQHIFVNLQIRTKSSMNYNAESCLRTYVTKHGDTWGCRSVILILRSQQKKQDLPVSAQIFSSVVVVAIHSDSAANLTSHPEILPPPFVCLVGLIVSSSENAYSRNQHVKRTLWGKFNMVQFASSKQGCGTYFDIPRVIFLHLSTPQVVHCSIPPVAVSGALHLKAFIKEHRYAISTTRGLSQNQRCSLMM